MRAAVLHEANKPLVIENVDVRKPGPHEVLLRTAFSALCHSARDHLPVGVLRHLRELQCGPSRALSRHHSQDVAR